VVESSTREGSTALTRITLHIPLGGNTDPPSGLLSAWVVSPLETRGQACQHQGSILHSVW
jgi:hypothetical protein